MADVIRVPDIGTNVDEVKLVSWLKKENDTVELGDVIAELETDKATSDLEATVEGTILKLMVGEGEMVYKGDILAYVGQPGEQIDVPNKEEKPESVEAADAAAENIQPESVEGKSEIKASPLVKNIARVKNIDLSRVPGTGPNGRIVKKDIDSYLNGKSKQPPKKEKKPDIKQGTSDYTGLSSNQLAVARTVSESLRTIPTVSFKVKIDMQNVIRYREQHSLGNEGKISYDSILIHEIAQTLRDFPKLCNTILNDKYIENEVVNIGLAIGVGADLFTPVIKNTGEKSVRELSNEIRLLAAKANQQRLTLEELSGGNFLFSNLGMYPVLEFNAIIPPGYGASMAVGAINEETVVMNKAIAIRPVCTFTLSTDHRLVNGREAAEFLQQLKYNLEELKI